jgi:integrase/recombinase XerD
MELPVFEVAQPRSKPATRQGEETKNMVARYVDTRRTEAAGSAILPLRLTQVWRPAMFTVRRCLRSSVPVELVDSVGNSVAPVADYLVYLASRGCSPHTIAAYAYDLRHLWTFLTTAELDWTTLTPVRAIALLIHLRTIPSRAKRTRGSGIDAERRLSPASVNRALAAISAFYDWAMLAGFHAGPNPIAKVEARAVLRSVDRHRPFLEGIARTAPVRRTLAVRTVHQVPRPLSDEEVTAILSALCCRRDLALVRLMLDGGLRPGEALGLQLEDVAYGRRRVVVRHREDHPRGVRAKGRRERVVDLHEPATLAAVADYVTLERPRDTGCAFLFLVGGHGRRCGEPLSYAALAKLFARACERAGVRGPRVTPHALRHTHATRMWEGGMRELALMRRLGHASPESTRVYTRVSDPAVIAEYRRALGMDGPAS